MFSTKEPFALFRDFQEFENEFPNDQNKKPK
jgi:hypothetical protein